jgi:hypothetical protein
VSNPVSGGTSAVPIEAWKQPDGSYRQTATITDVAAGLAQLLGALAALPLAVDPSSGRLRVTVDAVGAATLGTITTVTTLTNTAQVGGVAANSAVLDQMTSAWAGALRGRIT